jgi:hypothetical protein
MALRFLLARNCLTGILAAAMVAAVPMSAFAQDPRVLPPKQKKLPEAPSKLPKVGADRNRGLDFLFGALKAAPDEASAKHVEARIWALWLQTPSDTAALLMMRGQGRDGRTTDGRRAASCSTPWSSCVPTMSRDGTGARRCII